MGNSIVFDHAVNVLHKALNISTARQRMIAGNIANVDTVGYQPTDLDFQKTLSQALDAQPAEPLAQTHTKHYSMGEASQRGPVLQEASRISVDIDQQMTNLAENNLQYRTNLEMLLRKLAMIRYSITEGGR
ncbi:MAG: flagellar basal body rod protein FlgB [Deltaproteobacteria bacterium]|nr:flagellar basal body rod protein FlgB [Deltaproteobacteria bacterium]